MQYAVTSTIQSRDKSNPPAVVRWYSGPNHVQALAALVAAGAHTAADSNVPESARYDVLNVSMTITEGE